ncbi:hypothetical protein IIA15_05685, partial [candidate division TA06 bacterium]|nr:hypothetical protein [candidate division TA06 bacterium]
MKNKNSFLPLIFLSLLLPNAGARAGNVAVNWGNSCDTLLYDEFWVALADSDVVQLFKAVGSIDDPNCLGDPGGDDVLIATSKIGGGVFDPGDTISGCLSQSTIVTINCTSNDTTDTFYVRAWNDSNLDDATYYGDTRQNIGQEIWVISCNAITQRIGVTDYNSWATATEAPNLVNINGTSIAPPSINPGDENVGILQLDL